MESRQRRALRNGYITILGLLGMSLLLAFWIQESFSRRSAEIHRDFVREQETVTQLRRVLWMGGIVARDYFLNSAPDRHVVLQHEIERLQSEADQLILNLRSGGAADETVRELQARYRDLWSTLSVWNSHEESGVLPYDFIQQQVVPRRDATGRLLRELERTNRDALSESDARFDRSRSAAGASLLFLIAVCTVAGIATSYFSLRYSGQLEREAAAQFEQVSEAKRQLERLSARLMEIQEEERTRLSRELHDEVVQNIAVLKMEINRAVVLADSPDPATRPDLKRGLVDARALAENTMRSVRDISLLLRPSLLDDLGLGPALQALAEEFTRRTGTPCQLEEDGLDGDLPAGVNTCVYRVVQEALRNCEKHSHATHVRVAVARGGDLLTTTVSDNGVGFDSDPNLRRSPFHLGLLGMKERAAALGGMLTLQTGPHGGTSVILQVPLLDCEKVITPMEAHA